jgi:hypothetical protein
MLMKDLSKIIKWIYKVLLLSDGAANEQAAAQHPQLDAKVYKGVMWNQRGRDEFGNLTISERDLTFYKSVTPIYNRIMLQVPVKSICKVEVHNHDEDQFNIEIEYINQNEELAVLTFYIIMETETEGRDIMDRLQHFRSKYS